LTGDHAASQEKLSGALEQLRGARQQEQTLAMDTALVVASTSALTVVTIAAIVAAVATFGVTGPVLATSAVVAAVVTSSPTCHS